MQTPPQPPVASFWQYVLYSLATSALLGIGSVLTLLARHVLNRPKLRSETEFISAGAIKSRAEARASDGDVVKDAWERIDHQQSTIDELRAQRLINSDEIRELKRTLDEREARIKLLENQVDLRIRTNPSLPPFKPS